MGRHCLQDTYYQQDCFLKRRAEDMATFRHGFRVEGGKTGSAENMY